MYISHVLCCVSCHLLFVPAVCTCASRRCRDLLRTTVNGCKWCWRPPNREHTHLLHSRARLHRLCIKNASGTASSSPTCVRGAQHLAALQARQAVQQRQLQPLRQAGAEPLQAGEWVGAKAALVPGWWRVAVQVKAAAGHCGRSVLRLCEQTAPAPSSAVEPRQGPIPAHCCAPPRRASQSRPEAMQRQL